MENRWSPISIVILKFPSTLNHCTCSMGSVSFLGPISL